MRQSKPADNISVRVTYKKGKKHISFNIHNTRLEDWVDKQEIQTRIHISNRTLQYLRSRKQIPYAKFGDKILYHLPAIVMMIEQSMFI